MRIKNFLIGLAAGVFLISFAIVPAFASGTVVYDSLPSISPRTNYPSQPFQAQQTFEFGDYIHLGGAARILDKVTVTMSDWALYADYSSDPRYAGNSSYWTHPITLNVYSNHLNSNGIPDQKLASVTQDIQIPWRPPEDPKDCPTKDSPGYAYKWQSIPGAPDTNCNNGLAFNATFDLSNLHVTLPNDVIVSVAFNTDTWGANPIGQTGPYDSLNVAVPPNQKVFVGSDDSPDEVFWNTHTCALYSDAISKATCNSGIYGLLKDTNWTPYGTVALQVTANYPIPTTKVECREGGWKNYADSNGKAFKNQGQCIDYVEDHDRRIFGNVQYTAYGLQRSAVLEVDLANQNGFLFYHDADKDFYRVKISKVTVKDNTAWFAGVVMNSKNKTYDGNWLFGEVRDGTPDQIWGSFTNQATAENGVMNMTSPADGPFSVTRGNIIIR